ncbi:Erythromycin esterase [Syntrophobotulus glycolicus DSM 8271]|uniref:Erythromycin esterase n=1 Tax=Syntrophobotulus glycolicus (strain DSM 8271 / FlGlyR) TaxID=645991 RepID=F0SVR5_SYNGF|nr:erythromycin esterase family protein [Syntrophobotulus glycolicus]ADY55621.1 Erythromycin esterase [Syntrophobotulus glycolicus DSM 8271]
MQNEKWILSIIIMAILSVSLLAGCENKTAAVSADLSVLQTDISTLTVSENVQVVGLGEASHGTKEYQQMKAEVFKALVANNGCRTFIIEGDFGGALKVDAYIHGAEGTAKDVVGEIGFNIYHTHEMANLVDWMRSYNKDAPEGKDLHFYGMDIQRYDNNKEYLFSVLDVAAPALSKKYKSLSQLTDETRLTLSADVLYKSKTDVLGLLKEMDASKADIAAISGQTAFDFARESANTIYECSEILLSNNSDYNSLRDKYMSEKVNWFLQHRDDSVLFINGHNGHIGKTSTSGYTCLGELLTKDIGKSYFAIGTDAEDTEFNSQDNNGNFSVMEVKNRNELNSLLYNVERNFYYIDFSKVIDDENWQKLLDGQQKITTLNVGISGWQKLLKSFYTTTIVPNDTFDGMIVFKKVSPTTLCG